jgi:hypothetical protein
MTAIAACVHLHNLTPFPLFQKKQNQTPVACAFLRRERERRARGKHRWLKPWKEEYRRLAGAAGKKRKKTEGKEEEEEQLHKKPS